MLCILPNGQGPRIILMLPQLGIFFPNMTVYHIHIIIIIPKGAARSNYAEGAVPRSTPITTLWPSTNCVPQNSPYAEELSNETSEREMFNLLLYLHREILITSIRRD